MDHLEEDLLVVHLVVQAVGAEQQGVPPLQADAEQVALHGGLGAPGPGDVIFAGIVPGLVGGQVATVRRTLGGDIDASCGQLRRKYTKNPG